MLDRHRRRVRVDQFQIARQYVCKIAAIDPRFVRDDLAHSLVQQCTIGTPKSGLKITVHTHDQIASVDPEAVRCCSLETGIREAARHVANTDHRMAHRAEAAGLEWKAVDDPRDAAQRYPRPSTRTAMPLIDAGRNQGR